MFTNIRTLAEIGAGLVLLALFFWYRHSLIVEGEQIIKDNDKKVVAAQVIHNSEVEKRANELSSEQIKELKDKLAAPPASDAPKLVCLPNNQKRSSPVREVTNSGPGIVNPSEQPTVVPPASQPIDYGAAIDKRFQDDDSIIKALQERVKLDIKTCGS